MIQCSFCDYTVSGSTFENNYAQNQNTENNYNNGGAFYVSALTTLAISSSQFERLNTNGNNPASTYQVLYSVATELTLTLNTVTVRAQSSFNFDDDISDQLLFTGSLSSASTSAAGMLYVSGAVQITATYCTFENNFIGNTGGVFTLVSTKFTDSYSSYTNNAAKSGGCIHGTDSEIKVTSIQFYQNYA